LRAKFCKHSLAYFVCTVIFCYFFSHKSDVLISSHFLVQGFT
jgi:hypothetical protein